MDITPLLKQAKSYEKDFRVHKDMFEIYEGNLSKKIDHFFDSHFSPQTARYAKLRKSPINIQRKIIDKLSTIYQSPINRIVPDASSADEDLLGYYEDNFKINKVMNIADEFFNMSRSTLIQPYVHMNKPRLRAVPNDRFFVYSDDEIDPLNVTHVVICQDSLVNKDGLNTLIYHAYSDQEFIIFDSEGNVRRDLMLKIGNPDGINPYGKIPFVYINRSSNLIMPPADIDFLQMTMLIPCLLTDLNYASMFTMFSVMYGIDLEDSETVLAPNALWHLKSDPATDKKPQIGTIKNDADVAQTLELIRAQLAFWLETRSIKGGSIGDLNASNFASGISKLIDESDTTDEKKRQITHFREAEYDLWTLIIENLHPVWAASGQIDNRISFSPGAYVEVDFVDPVPLVRRGQLVDDLKKEVDAGFITKKRAIAMINPDKSDEWVDELVGEIEGEKTIIVETVSGTAESQNPAAQGV